MPVHLYTTNYLHWHVANTSNRESMFLCCIRVVVEVEQAFYEHGIQLNLAVVRLTGLAGAGISGVSLCTQLDPAFCIMKFLVLLGKYLSNTRVAFDV